MRFKKNFILLNISFCFFMILSIVLRGFFTLWKFLNVCYACVFSLIYSRARMCICANLCAGVHADAYMRAGKTDITRNDWKHAVSHAGIYVSKKFSYLCNFFLKQPKNSWLVLTNELLWIGCVIWVEMESYLNRTSLRDSGTPYENRRKIIFIDKREGLTFATNRPSDDRSHLL